MLHSVVLPGAARGCSMQAIPVVRALVMVAPGRPGRSDPLKKWIRIMKKAASGVALFKKAWHIYLKA